MEFHRAADSSDSYGTSPHKSSPSTPNPRVNLDPKGSATMRLCSHKMTARRTQNLADVDQTERFSPRGSRNAMIIWFCEKRSDLLEIGEK